MAALKIQSTFRGCRELGIGVFEMWLINLHGLRRCGGDKILVKCLAASLAVSRKLELGWSTVASDLSLGSLQELQAFPRRDLLQNLFEQCISEFPAYLELGPRSNKSWGLDKISFLLPIFMLHTATASRDKNGFGTSSESVGCESASETLRQIEQHQL